MTTKKPFAPLLGQVLQKIAPRIGAKVVMEPEWNVVGQIIFKNGRKRYFRYSSLDLNSLGSSEVAKDKDYANFFMKRMGYKIIPHSKTFYRDDWGKAIGQPRRNIAAAHRHAQKIGFPVVVKPNSGSQGSGVSLAHNKQEFYRAVKAAFTNDRIVLVQPQVKGKDYRLVVLDKRVISAYEREPISVVGNGKATIMQLIKLKQQEFILAGRDTQLRPHDPRIKEKLKRDGLTFRSIVPRGERIYLLNNANLSTGGDSVDVTAIVHPSFKKLAVQLTKDMGLRLCGVDLMVRGDITQKPNEYWILEINSAPGLDHYVQTGKAQEKIVEALYLEVLKSMEKSG
ncbi:MAG: cyanophycin synthetase [Patescibacteria group bacterium]